MSKLFSLYLGQAGQELVMSLFLKRGYNVAVPLVDVGDDIFVVEDFKGLFKRVQVKTASAKKRNKGFSAQFKIPLTQLETTFEPELYYVFTSDFENKWQPVLVIPQSKLLAAYENNNIGTPKSGYLLLYFSYQNKATKVTCSNTDFTSFLENWEDFPIISH